MVTQAEQLPTEIWLNVFSYFEGHNLVRTFSRLNFFFDSLLRSTYLRLYLRIEQGDANRQLPEWTWSYINRENIYSLSSEVRKSNCLLQFLHRNASSLTNLTSLAVDVRRFNVFSHGHYSRLISALEEISSLHRLQIKCSSELNRQRRGLELLFNAIFSRQFRIRTYSIAFDMSTLAIITSIWRINPFIQHLSIEKIDSHILLPLLSCTPQLRSLRTVWYQLNNPVDRSISLPCLNKVRLRIERTRFDQLQLLKEWAPNLRSFRAMGSFDRQDMNYLNENLWRKFLHNFQDFQVSLTDGEYNSSRQRLLIDHIENFNTENWFSYKDENSWIRLSISIHS